MFTKKRIVSLMLAVVMSMSLILTSCTVAGGNYPGTADPKSVTVDVGAEPPKLNSIITSDVVSINVLRHVCDGLTMLDKNDKAIPGVAEKWDISEDKLTYTFHLRKDYKWSDGTPVTAKDFEFAFRQLIDPKVAATYSSLGFIFKNAQAFFNGEAAIEDVGIKAIDDYTFEVVLENPVAYILDLLAFVVFLPVNQAAYEKHGEAYATDAENMLTNGAYKVTSWSHDDKIVLDKNAEYPMAADIKIEQIIMTMMTDSNTRMNAFKAGENDMIELLAAQATSLREENQPVTTYDDGSIWYIQYNFKSPLLSNKNFRLALSYAIKSDDYVKDVVQNTSKSAKQFTPLTVNGNKKKFAEELGEILPGYDSKKAKEYLELAKKELGMDTFKLKLLGSDSDFSKSSLAYFQEMWKTELGVECEINAQPFKSRLKLMEDNEFDMVMAGWSPDYNDPLTFLDLWETTNGNNYGKYSSPEYDKLIADSRKEADRDKRFGMLMDAEKIMLADAAAAPYYFRAKDYTVSSKIVGDVRTAFQDLNLRWAEIK